MSRKINWSDAPFNWPAEPALDEKALNSPQPCSHGSSCRYNGPCAFVHKGEEGTGRRLFPARTVDGKEQAACVRLIGSPSFYERRRLRLSWPEWCAKKGIQHGSSAQAQKPAVSASPSASAAWPPLPYVAPVRTAVWSAPLAQQPFSAQQPLSAQQMTPQAQPFYPAGYGMGAGISMEANYLLQQAIAQHGSLERAVEFNRQQLLWQQAQAAAAAAAAKKAKEDERNEYGQKLYDKFVFYSAEFKPLMGDNWPKDATAGKLTAMMLELDKEEWDKMLSDEAAFEEKLKEGLDVLDAAAKYKAAEAAGRAAN